MELSFLNISCNSRMQRETTWKMILVKIRITNFVQFHKNTIHCFLPARPVTHLRSSKKVRLNNLHLFSTLYKNHRNFKDGLNTNWVSSLGLRECQVVAYQSLALPSSDTAWEILTVWPLPGNNQPGWSNKAGLETELSLTFPRGNILC